MNLRELLRSLQAVDEQHLDKEVLVSAHTGGYDAISHVSVLYVGHPVIHLAEPKPPEPPPDIWAGSAAGDLVAPVNPADLRAAWKMYGDIRAHAGEGAGSIDIRSFQQLSSSGSDGIAVWYRSSMLAMLQQMMPETLSRWTHDGEVDDAVFQVLATFPIKKMPVGVPQEGAPFDVDEFVRQIEART
jgi:hypothetical protein